MTTVHIEQNCEIYAECLNIEQLHFILIQAFTFPTGRNFGGSISHIYAAIGYYNFSVTASNLFSNITEWIEMAVQIPITNFTILPPPSLAWGTLGFVYVHIDTGSHVALEGTYGDNITVTNFTVWDNGTVYLVLDPADYPEIGIYQLTITAENLLGPKFSEQTTMAIDYPVTDWKIRASKSVITTDTAVTFKLSMTYGSRFTVNFDWDDETSTKMYHDVLISPQKLYYNHIFTKAKEHKVKLTITDKFTIHRKTLTILVQAPVEGIVMHCDSPVGIPQNGVATTKCLISQPFLYKTICSSMADVEYQCDNNTSNCTGLCTPGFNGTCNYTVEEMGNFTCAIDADGTVASDRCKSIKCVTCTSGPDCYCLEGESSPCFSCSSRDSDATCAGLKNNLIPSNSTKEYSWKDGSTDTDSLDEGTFSTTGVDVTLHEYTTYKTYGVKLIVSNAASSMTFNQAIIVNQFVTSPQISAASKYVAFGDEVEFNLTLDWGTRFDIRWQWQDSSPDSTFHYETYNETMNAAHTFIQAGIHRVSVVASNENEDPSSAQDSLSEEEAIVVQHPARDLLLNCKPRAALIEAPDYEGVKKTCHIYHKTATPAPTDVLYEVDYGDGAMTGPHDLTIISPTQTDVEDYTHIHSFTFESGYLHGGDYSITVRVWNMISNTLISDIVSIYEDISNLRKVPLSVVEDGNTTTMIPGHSTDNLYFPIEEPIVFTTSFDRGSHISYEWNLGDGNAESTNRSSVVHFYNDPGAYKVILIATNPLSEKTLETLITVQRSLFNVNFSTPTPVYPKNRTFHFYVLTEVPATDACYFIDYHETSSLTPYNFFAGDQSQCQLSFAEAWAKPNRQFQQLSEDDFVEDEPIWSFSHKIMVKGVFDLTLLAENRVSSQTVPLQLVVTRGPCFLPKVDIANQPIMVCDPEIDCTNGIKSYYKAKTIQVSAYIRTNCEATYISHYNWTLQKKNEKTGIMDNVNTDGMGIEFYKKLTYPEKHQLIIFKPKQLDYGRYRVRFSP